MGKLMEFLVWVEKIGLMVLTIALFVYFYIMFINWGEPFKEYFLKAGDLQWWIYIFAFVLLVNYVLKKLVLMEAHILFGKPKRGRRRR